MKVLLIDAIGLQTAYLGCYGNDWIITPQLDRLVCDAVVFDRHYADRPSIRNPTGDWLRHGRYRIADANQPETEFPDDLLQFLQPQSAEFADETLASLERMMNRDNCVVYAMWTGLLPPWEIPQTYLDDYFDDDSLTPWLDPPTGPFPEEDWQNLHYTYSAAVTYFDEQLGELLNGLYEREWQDELLICVTAQSGFALGEHGYIGEHRAWQHDEIVHVPLLCRLPKAEEAGRRIATLTQPVDLAATIWNAVGYQSESGHGFNVMPLMVGETARVREYACSGLQVGESVEWALRTQDWAYLLPRQYPPDDPERREQLYAKPEDHYEVNDLSQQHFDFVEQLEKVLREFVEETQKPGPMRIPELPD